MTTGKVGRTQCDKCGAEYRIGEWPFCPHGELGGGGYSPFEPYVDPHILPSSDPRANASEFNRNLGRVVHGTLIESREQRRKIMKEQNLDWAPREYGRGGTEY